MTRPPPNPPEDLTAAVRWLQAENENLRAEIERLKAGMHEYACTGTDHPCGCYDQFLSEKAEIERLNAIKIAADKAYRYHMLGYKEPTEFNANVMLDLMNELGALL